MIIYLNKLLKVKNVLTQPEHIVSGISIHESIFFSLLQSQSRLVHPRKCNVKSNQMNKWRIFSSFAHQIKAEYHTFATLAFTLRKETKQK